jgi:hypothetical protein
MRLICFVIYNSAAVCCDERKSSEKQKNELITILYFEVLLILNSS